MMSKAGGLLENIKHEALQEADITLIHMSITILVCCPALCSANCCDATVGSFYKPGLTDSDVG